MCLWKAQHFEAKLKRIEFEFNWIVVVSRAHCLLVSWFLGCGERKPFWFVAPVSLGVDIYYGREEVLPDLCVQGKWQLNGFISVLR